jgi:hypothetical protein
MQSVLRSVGLCTIIFAASFSIRFVAVDQTPYANGWDGYYYINQVKALLEEGRMDVPDSSLVYPLLVIIQLVTHDYVLSFKILTCLLAATFSLVLFLLSRKWSENEKASLVLGTFSLFSPHLTYFSAQYPKNLLGVILFLALLYSLESRMKFMSFVLLVLNFFGHRVTAVLSFLVLLIHYSFGKLPRRMLVICGLLLLMMFTGVGLLVPGVLNVFDIERLQGIFSASPQFAPMSFIRTFGLELISIPWLIEIVMACALFIFSTFYMVNQIRRHKIDRRLVIVLIVLLVLICPFFNWSLEGPAFRFVLMFILLCPVLGIFFISQLRNNYIILISCGTFCSLGLSNKTYNPEKHDPPYAVYHKVNTQILSMHDTASLELIVGHKSMAEFIVYETGIDAMSWLPEYSVDKEKLWRVAADVKDVQFRYYLSSPDLMFVKRLTPSYCFVREDVWQKLITLVKADNNIDLINDLNTWRNPDKVRPFFMMKNKR